MQRGLALRRASRKRVSEDLAESFAKAFWIASVLASFLFVVQAPVGAQSAGARPADGVSLYSQKKYREALEAFRVQKQTATVLYYEGLCYASLQDQNTAKTLFQHIKQNFPQSPEARLVDTYLSTIETQAPTKAASATPSEIKEASEEAARKAELSKLPDRVKVEYKKDRGLMRMKATVNGSREDFVFDTGAELTVVNRETASKLKFDPAKCVRTMTSTPRGPEPAVLTEATIEFGELTRKVKVIIMNLPVNLIGANFWDGYNYEIDEWFIRLNKKKTESNIALRPTVNSKFFVPFEQVGNLMQVKIEMNGISFPAVFDTGCQGDDISICPQHAMKLGLRSPYINYVERFDFGPIMSHHVPARINQGEFTLIGPELLGGRRFTIDRERKTIEFSY